MSLNIFNLATVVRQLDPNASPVAIIKRLSQIELGLSAEDEFQSIAVWLGKCLLCHKLEEVPFVSSDFKSVRIPDMIAVFSVEDRQVPVAIEVKSTLARTLSWKSTYYEELSRYGMLTGLPVLVAWKHRNLGIWTLTDILAFKQGPKNRLLSTNDAFRENLLGILAGDVVYQLMDEVGLHIEAIKKELLATDYKRISFKGCPSRELRCVFQIRFRAEASHVAAIFGIHSGNSNTQMNIFAKSLRLRDPL